MFGHVLFVFSSLLIPFLWFGEFISGGSHFPLTADAMKKILTFQASKQVLIGAFHAVRHKSPDLIFYGLIFSLVCALLGFLLIFLIRV